MAYTQNYFDLGTQLRTAATELRNFERGSDYDRHTVVAAGNLVERILAHSAVHEPGRHVDATPLYFAVHNESQNLTATQIHDQLQRLANQLKRQSFSEAVSLYAYAVLDTAGKLYQQ
jgi:hypothetical protein